MRIVWLCFFSCLGVDDDDKDVEMSTGDEKGKDAKTKEAKGDGKAESKSSKSTSGGSAGSAGSGGSGSSGGARVTVGVSTTQALALSSPPAAAAASAAAGASLAVPMQIVGAGGASPGGVVAMQTSESQ